MTPGLRNPLGGPVRHGAVPMESRENDDDRVHYNRVCLSTQSTHANRVIIFSKSNRTGTMLTRVTLLPTSSPPPPSPPQRSSQPCCIRNRLINKSVRGRQSLAVTVINPKPLPTFRLYFRSFDGRGKWISGKAKKDFPKIILCRLKRKQPLLNAISARPIPRVFRVRRF